ISVGLLIATGIVRGGIWAGSVPALIGTDYGRLLLAKVALFFAMVAVAAVNRLRLTPRLALAISSPPCGQALAHERDADGAPAAARTALGALARNSLVEATFGLAILVIVGALGTLPPGAHVLQPTWPFAVRYSNAAFGDAELRAALVLALWGLGLRRNADPDRRAGAARASAAGAVADRGRRHRRHRRRCLFRADFELGHGRGLSDELLRCADGVFGKLDRPRCESIRDSLRL